jgi:hypothetical protein
MIGFKPQLDGFKPALFLGVSWLKHVKTSRFRREAGSRFGAFFQGLVTR